MENVYRNRYMTDDQQHTNVTGFVAFEPIKGVYRLQFSRAALLNKRKYLEENVWGLKKQIARDLNGGKDPEPSEKESEGEPETFHKPEYGEMNESLHDSQDKTNSQLTFNG